MLQQNGMQNFCWVLIAISVIASCTAQKASLADAEFIGSYTLVSVDGQVVPADVMHGRTKLKVLRGIFTINPNGTCRSTTVFIPPPGQQVTRDVSATYVRQGANLTMQWKGFGVTVGTVQGNSFSMDNHGMLFVYTKQ